MVIKKMNSKFTLINTVSDDINILVFRGFICKRTESEKYKTRNCILLQTSNI